MKIIRNIGNANKRPNVLKRFARHKSKDIGIIKKFTNVNNNKTGVSDAILLVNNVPSTIQIRSSKIKYEFSKSKFLLFVLETHSV